jgi:hypothetical protein
MVFNQQLQGKIMIEIQHLIKLFSFLTFLPDSEHTYSSGYDTYLMDVQQQVVLSKKSCSNWVPDPLNPIQDAKSAVSQEPLK